MQRVAKTFDTQFLLFQQVRPRHGTGVSELEVLGMCLGAMTTAPVPKRGFMPSVCHAPVKKAIPNQWHLQRGKSYVCSLSGVVPIGKYGLGVMTLTFAPKPA